MKDVAVRKGDPSVADRSDEEVLGLPGIASLEERMWAAMQDPKRAGQLDALLKAMERS